MENMKKCETPWDVVGPWFVKERIIQGSFTRNKELALIRNGNYACRFSDWIQIEQHQ